MSGLILAKRHITEGDQHYLALRMFRGMTNFNNDPERKSRVEENKDQIRVFLDGKGRWVFGISLIASIVFFIVSTVLDYL